MSTSAGRVLILPKGNYNASTTYNMLDCVYYNGRSYLCKQTSIGNPPTNTTYWQPMSPDSSAEIQALTNYTADTGVKNLHDVSGSEISGVYGVTVTRLSKGYKLESTMTGSWLHAYFSQKLEKNTDYVLTTDITFSSGLGAIYIYGKVTGGSNVEIKHIDGINASGGKTIEFNSGNYDEYQIYLSITGTPSTTGDITFDNFMVRDASITDPTYQPYAKTNVELTQDVAEITSGSYLVKRGKLVQLAVNTWTAKSSITIPADFRPRKQMIFVIEQRKESAPTEIVFNRLTIGTDGSITLLGENDQLLGSVYWFTA